jgi:hypothetical protein
MEGVIADVEMVSLSVISVATTYQTRHRGGSAGLDDNHVTNLAESLIDDVRAQLAPVWLRRHTDEATGEVTLDLIAGFHRKAAYVVAKRAFIPAIVHDVSHVKAFELAALSNALDQLVWTRAERILTVRDMLADEEMGMWGFDRIAEIVKIRSSLVADQWASMNPGVTEREVLGRDGVRYTVKVKQKAETLPPVDMSFIDEGSDGELSGMASAGGSLPIAQNMSIAAPSANFANGGMGGGRMGAPIGSGQTSSGGMSRPAGPPQIMPSQVPGMGGGQIVLSMPRKPHPSQSLVELNITYVLASDEEGQLVSDGNTDPRPMPAAVRLELIRWLQAQV